MPVFDLLRFILIYLLFEKNSVLDNAKHEKLKLKRLYNNVLWFFFFTDD
ncbi:Uncharacterised protein [Flavobacterium hibernum]|nr:Uncharacterised protein [Flavobacterium hibernum]